MQGLVTVFGGSGFVGSQVVRALAKKGFRVRAAMRNPGRGYRLRLLGDVGQIQVAQANVRDADSVARALDGAEAVVNLVGVLYESGRQTFSTLHEQAAAEVATQALHLGARRFIQVSAIGADASSSSAYLRSKAAGEAAVSAAFPGATILRPSLVFGPEDHFFNRFGAMATLSPVLPLIGGGETKFQPVFVGDVAQAVATAVDDPATAGRTYELGGPGVFSFRELMEFVMASTGRRRVLLPLPFAAARLLGSVAGLAALTPLAPPLTVDQVEALRTDNVVGAGMEGLEALGVVPTPIEAVAPAYLARYRRGGQYALAGAAA